MSIFADKLLDSVKLNLREASDDFDEEIKEYIDACATDLQDVGILSYYFTGENEIDPQIKQAVKWYCRSSYGFYNADMEKYAKAYASLKATLATQKKYIDKGYEKEDLLDIKSMQEKIRKNEENIQSIQEAITPISKEEIDDLFEEAEDEQG